MNMCHDSADTAVSGDQYSLQRLQVEVDQFFLRAAYQIISAHRYTVHEGGSFQYGLFYSLFSMKEEGCLHLPTCLSVGKKSRRILVTLFLFSHCVRKLSRGSDYLHVISGKKKKTKCNLIQLVVPLLPLYTFKVNSVLL